MADCEFEADCINCGSVKCNLCLIVAEHSTRNSGGRFRHYPCFKDKLWYARTIPYINLKGLFPQQGVLESMVGGAVLMPFRHFPPIR
jgi:hypothetical protein